MLLHRRYFRLAPLDPPLALFFVSALLGLWPAHDRGRSWNTLIALGAGVSLYFVISRLASSRSRWRAVATSVILAGALVSLYFITQYGHFGYPDKFGLIHRLGTWIGRLVPSAVMWVPQTNSVAAFLEGILFLAIALVITEERRSWRVAGAAAVGLIAVALLFSVSRGAWLAVLVALWLWLAFYWSPARWILCIGAGVALALVVWVIAQRDVTLLASIPIIDRTLAPVFIRPDRLDVYRNSLYLIQDFPLTGIGLGEQFAMVLSKYALLIQVPYLTYSHNLYLEVWLQQGLLGAVAWLWLIAGLYMGACTYAESRSDLCFQATWLGLTAIFVHGLSDARQYVDLWCWFPFFALLGLNGALTLHGASAKPAGGLPGRRCWVIPTAAVVAFLVAVGVRLHPLPAACHANYGSVLQARADLSESLDDRSRAALRQRAADHYWRAIQTASYDRTAQQRLGLMMMEEDRFEEAVEHLEVALHSNPHNTTTHKALGLAYVWVGELDRAKPLLSDVPEIVEELDVWAWWRDSRGQAEQSINAARMAELLASEQP